jgi:hypothetical protein
MFVVVGTEKCVAEGNFRSLGQNVLQSTLLRVSIDNFDRPSWEPRASISCSRYFGRDTKQIRCGWLAARAAVARLLYKWCDHEHRWCDRKREAR